MWIEITDDTQQLYCLHRSPSTRRVWIEIVVYLLIFVNLNSHPPHGGCGLKLNRQARSRRNFGSPSTRRVWIEIALVFVVFIVVWSPSTRRVWIEIVKEVEEKAQLIVTLHTEGVD